MNNLKEKLLFAAFLAGVYALICFCFDSTEASRNDNLVIRRAHPDHDVFIDQYGDTVNRTDNKGRRQGKWVIYRAGIDGSLSGSYGIDSVGYFKDNKKVGFWKKISKWGELVDSVRYENCIVKLEPGKTYTFYVE
ncbi:MAG: hypothetical protein ACXVPQ_10335 [Bacteroidia bacterium]